MKKIVLLFGVLLASPALAQGDAPPPPPPAQTSQVTQAQRDEMAKVHERMAECLRSNRPLQECHDELWRGCQAAGGPGCMGPMWRRGRMGPRP